ncbi:hypothetical protein BKA62DRAFT_739217 [Auriculariales sp. MPI-PUGE-AT-0066]|nr:hypothetical protein BKA62DRAFT_739217 [Auriculariales sp. MPI-PUGE-AT-0066]
MNNTMQQQMFSFRANPVVAPPSTPQGQQPFQFVPFTPQPGQTPQWPTPVANGSVTPNASAGKTTARSRGRPKSGQPQPSPMAPLQAVPVPMPHMMGPPVAGYPPSMLGPPPIQPPPHPLPTTQQAKHTSYASRMRTGASMLVQPIINPFARPVEAPQPTGLTTGRSRKSVNYTEAASDDDFDSEAGDTDSADSDEAPRRKRGRRPKKEAADLAGPPAEVKVEEVDQSYLGQIPPARFIQSVPATQTKHNYYPQLDVDRESRKPVILIPIRVELDTDVLRVRDAFVWNLNEELISPESFASAFCADIGIPDDPFMAQIAASIRAQLEEHANVAAMDLRGGPDDDEPVVDPDDPGELEQLPDVRVTLSLDVQIDARHLIDHIEWDLLSPLLPEDFARALCADIGLSGEAVPLVAHAVHEELLKHKRDALEWGLVEDVAGAYVRNLGLGGGGWGKQGNNPRRLKSVWREWNEIEEYGYAPRLEVLSQEELERREMERERAQRRLRRETSRFTTTTTSRRRR